MWCIVSVARGITLHMYWETPYIQRILQDPQIIPFIFWNLEYLNQLVLVNPRKTMQLPHWVRKWHSSSLVSCKYNGQGPLADTMYVCVNKLGSHSQARERQSN